MRATFITLSAIGFAACSAKKETSQVEASKKDHMFECTGHYKPDRLSSEDFVVKVDRARADEAAFIPVDIVIERKVNTNTAKPSWFETYLTTTGRLQLGAQLKLTFAKGELNAGVTNTGVTGATKVYEGKLKLFAENKTVDVSCPVRK